MNLLMYLSCLLGVFLSANIHAMPASIIIIRQAEKAPNNEYLSQKGRQRASAIVPYILETPEFTAHGPPVAIYASIPQKPDSSQRSIETVKNLADALKLPIHDTYESHDYKHMVDEIKNNPAFTGKTVIICWDHQVIPEIARAFGALQSPATWPNSSHDRAWLITLQHSGKATIKNLPQRLLFGDSST